MSSILLNNARVTSVTVKTPFYGAWSADVTMAAADEIVDTQKRPTTAVTLVIGDLTLRGTIVRQAVYGGARSIWIVAGAGGWRNVIAAKGYAQSSGIKLSTVLNDAARAAGESIVIGTDRTIGTSYAREKAAAERVLALETAGAWWIDTSGVTQLAARTSTLVVAPFTVVKHLGGAGQFEIATDTPSQWQPGRTFTAPQTPGTHTISSVTLDASNDGKVRLFVLAKFDGLTERLLVSIRKLIRAEMAQQSYAGVWEYTIVSGTTTTVDVKSDHLTMPDLTKVPMMPGLLGEVVLPTAGAKCRIRFVNNDPTRPECVGIVGDSRNSTVDVSSGLLKVNEGSQFAALANLVNANFATLATLFTAHAHPTGVGPSGPPAVPMVAASDFPSVACTKLKTD